MPLMGRKALVYHATSTQLNVLLCELNLWIIKSLYYLIMFKQILCNESTASLLKVIFFLEASKFEWNKRGSWWRDLFSPTGTVYLFFKFKIAGLPALLPVAHGVTFLFTVYWFFKLRFAGRLFWQLECTFAFHL